MRNAHIIFSPDLCSLKGKTTRKKEPHVEMETQAIPPEVLERHREITIGFDVLFVNSIAFAVSISRALKFAITEAIKDRKASTLLTSITRLGAVLASRVHHELGGRRQRFRNTERSDGKY